MKASPRISVLDESGPAAQCQQCGKTVIRTPVGCRVQGTNFQQFRTPLHRSAPAPCHELLSRSVTHGSPLQNQRDDHGKAQAYLNKATLGIPIGFESSLSMSSSLGVAPGVTQTYGVSAHSSQGSMGSSWDAILQVLTRPMCSWITTTSVSTQELLVERHFGCERERSSSRYLRVPLAFMCSSGDRPTSGQSGHWPTDC